MTIGQMTGVPQQRRLEQALTVIRVVALVAATVEVSQRSAAAPDIAASAIPLLIALAVGTIAIAVLNSRLTTRRSITRLAVVAFAFDVVVVFGAVWIWASSSTLAGAMLLLIPVEAALRFRLVGSMIGALVSSLFFALVIADSANDRGVDFDAGSVAFLAMLSFAVAGLVGWMTQGWHERTTVVEKHSARLFEMDKLKDRYIAMTSHEIRGPLTAMITAVDTVRTRWDKLAPERRDHLLEMVYLQGHQLDRLVEDLMISAEVESGGLSISPQWVELEPAIKRALDAAAAKRRAHLLEVFVEPLRAEIDPYRISQVIRNLVENAYKYTPDRTRVAVSAKGVDNGLLLEVADDGEGIPPGKRDQLFEAFSRIEETSAGQEGVGLGLYVVSQLVAAMDGRIDLASSSRGTTFSIVIPCKSMRAEQQHIGLVQDDERGASGV
jgi:signal transduction histidine kinase